MKIICWCPSFIWLQYMSCMYYWELRRQHWHILLRLWSWVGCCGNTANLQIFSLSWDTSYPDWSFPWFFLFCPCKCQNNLSLKLQVLPSKSFPGDNIGIFFSTMTLSRMLW
jgi:hypothetical protein